MLNAQTKKLGTVTILSLQGPVVIGETEILNSAVQALRETSRLILDLSGVNSIDAHGLGVLLAVR